MISDELERKMEEIFDTTCPDIYLRQLYDTPEKLKSFAIYLRSALPPRADINYYHKKNIPVAPVDRRPGEGVYCVELLCCGFAQECSLKPSVSTKVAKQLIGEYAKDGFITVDEPLRITQPVNLNANAGSELSCMPDWAHTDENPAMSIFSLGYVKGMARTTTALAWMAFCHQQNIDISLTNPTLYESLRMVYVLHEEGSEDKVTALINAAKLSTRGSIRKPYNVLEWTASLLVLKGENQEEDKIIKHWNRVCSCDFLCGRLARLGADCRRRHEGSS